MNPQIYKIYWYILRLGWKPYKIESDGYIRRIWLTHPNGFSDVYFTLEPRDG